MTGKGPATVAHPVPRGKGRLNCHLILSSSKVHKPSFGAHAPHFFFLEQNMIIPVILAGGSGTRLWPLSRKLYPKQLLPLIDDRTLVQNTLLRLQGLDEVAPPIIICNEEHRFIIAEQMRALGVSPAAIILEPVGRNTAPAVAISALKALEQTDLPGSFLRPLVFEPTSGKWAGKACVGFHLHVI